MYNRQEGFYWVQMDDEIWHVAEWQDGDWYLTGRSAAFIDTDFLLIADKPILPPSK